MTITKTLRFWAAFFLLLSSFFTLAPALAQSTSSQAVNFAESIPVRQMPPAKVKPGTKVVIRELDERREQRAAKIAATERAARGGLQTPDTEEAVREINKTNREVTRKVDPNAKNTQDTALSSKKLGKNAKQAHLPNPPSVSFEGVSIANTSAVGQGFLPPDTNGAVGPNHYVQTVNSCLRVWDKAGNPLTPVTPFSTFFAALGSPCGSSNDGDPVVLYDQLADRWIVTEFCTVANPNNHQLIAVSKNGDPTGSYYLYDFVMPNNKFNDYPKFGVWPDAYYMTDNQFNQAGTTFLQAGAFAFNRAKLLVGDPTASYVYFDTAVVFPPGGINGPDGIGGMLPASLDGFTPPPAGAPCPFAYFQAGEFGEPGDRIRIFDFHVDFATPANSTFTERTGSPLTVAAFDPVTVPDSRNVVPQPPPANSGSYVDAINDRLMFRLAYRNFGTSETLIANHTVNAATNPAYRAGVRWYELTRATPAAAFTIAEQETFAPADTENRWMGSGAMNFQGDIVVGYSVSSTAVFPSIRYAAKLNTDPPGSGLIQGEQSLIAGAGSQTHTSGRWGDYSSMSVDPSDDCSFWYTQEYFPVSSEPGNTTTPWHTRITKIAPGPCTSSARGTISGTITNCQSGLPIANAIVNITGGFSRATANNGTYSAIVPPGTYNVTATGTGYDTASTSGLVVTDGGNATFNACLTGNLKQPVADTANITADGCNSNGIIDPNETVTVNFGIKNTGTLSTANLVGTLQATGGVTSPSAPQTYGVVVAGGATVFKSFTFTAGNFACGTQLVATMQLQDGATNLGTITYNFVIGVLTSSVYATGDIAVAIPDNNPTGVDIPLTVADVTTLSDVNVSFRLNHTYDGDLIISLVHPDNTVVTLVNRRGSSGANFGTGTNNCSGTPTVIDDQAATAIAAGVAPFAGSFKPESPLSVLNGKASNGTWKLRVSDVANLDTGSVGCFKLELNKRSVCCGALIGAVPPAVVTAENGFPVNGVPDPGETVRVNLSLANTGLNNTTNLVGTLQATGGVTTPGGPQTYGVVVAGGPSVARPFTFTASGNCGDTITLTLALQDGPNNLGNVTYTLRLGTITSATQTFSNSTPIIIPASGTGSTSGSPANPYPSSISVSGVPTTIAKLTMTINAFNHTFPDDVDLLLVSPTGRKMIVMSDCGGSTVATNLVITLDDDAVSALPDGGIGSGLTSGTFKPSNYDTVQDPFPVPAPPGPYLTPQTGGTATLTSAFTGVAGGNPNGTWGLYVVDDASLDTGNINGGWQLALTSSTNVCGGLITAASIKSHGGTPYPIPMPLVGTPGIECRSNSATNDYQLAVTFPVTISVTGAPQAQVTSGSGTVGTGGIGNGGTVSVAGNVVTVLLTNVANAQTINVTLFGVSDGVSVSNIVVPMSVLFGDVNGDGFVLSGDYTATRQKSGTPVDGNTFIFDVNTDGFILSGDYTAVRQQSGTQLP